MCITRLTAFHVRIPLKQTVRHASHTRESNETLIICCELSDGSVGWGEGLPRPYVTGETIDTAWAQLQQTDFRSQLDGALTTVPAALELLSGFIVSPLSDDEKLKSEISNLKPRSRDCFGNSVRCAVELSVLDAVCRRVGLPLSHVTTLVPETLPIRQSSPHVRYSGIITAMSSWQQVRSSLKQRLYGFRQCKVKLGVKGIDDVTTLRRVRRILGRQVDLRVDVNEAWSCGELSDKLNRLAPFGIMAVEQPVPHAEVAGLAEIRTHCPVPIMLDESVCSLSDAHAAIDQGLCDLFNIRLSKCGGFVNSLRLAATAHAAGLGYQLGCQVGETGILSAAGRHFATSVAGLRYLEGSYDRHLVAERLTTDDLTFGYGGWASALTAPGLGVTVDQVALSRCTVRQLELMER